MNAKPKVYLSMVSESVYYYCRSQLASPGSPSHTAADNAETVDNMSLHGNKDKIHGFNSLHVLGMDDLYYVFPFVISDVFV